VCFQNYRPTEGTWQVSGYLKSYPRHVDISFSMDCCNPDGGSFLLRVRKVPVAEFTEQERQAL